MWPRFTVFLSLVSLLFSPYLIASVFIEGDGFIQEEVDTRTGDLNFIAAEWQAESAAYTDKLVGGSDFDSVGQLSLMMASDLTYEILLSSRCDRYQATILLPNGQLYDDVRWEITPGQPPAMGGAQILQFGIYPIEITTPAGCVIFDTVVAEPIIPREIDVVAFYPPCQDNETVFAEIVGFEDILELTLDGQIIPIAESVPIPGNRPVTIAWVDNLACRGEQILEAEDLTEQVVVSLPPSQILEFGERLQLQPQIISGVPPFTFQWQAAEGLSCTDCQDPVVSPTQNTDYVLLVTDANGCTASAVVRVVILVDEENLVFVPTAFSPNLDGINDFLFPGFSPAVIQVQSFQIYDRWGGMLYQVEDVPADNGPSWGWNGESNGRPATVGVYVWTLEVLLPNGRTRSLAGDVMLIR
ncbi:MAG: gliding motility-associated C-terminal domain-containing protein [Bacteroidota bacterium]